MRFNVPNVRPAGRKVTLKCRLQSGFKSGMLLPANTDRLVMSEFKYACPVCGQHIKCDSTQSGTTMECPTCFQKIVAPQAPATDDPKFIITGTKVGERPIPAAVANAGAAPAPLPEKSSPAPVIVFIALFCVAAVVLFAFHGKIFKPSGGQVNAPGGPSTPGRPPPPKPVVVAPPAEDARWMLNLEAATIPDLPAAGRIHGQDFIVERASFQNGTLTLRRGTRGPVDFGIIINFSGAQVGALAAQTINVTTNTDEAARVTLRWDNDVNSGRVNFDTGYALRLEFGLLDNNSHMPGKIYLCTPDAEKSYLSGTFSIEVRKPKPPKQK
jgi:DNA-directed RNA polymerase subunit RPC12/RpoP